MNITKTKKTFFWFFIVIFLYIFLELISMAFIQIYHIKSTSYGYPKSLYIYDEKLDYKYKPNFRGHFPGQLYSSIEINTNSLGLRDDEFKLTKPPGAYRILVLGDSITFGAGVKLENTYVKQTEKLLHHSNGQNYQIINAGVNSYHFEHYYIFIKENIDKFNPDHIVIGFCINDVRPKNKSSFRHIVKERRKSIFSSSIKHVIKEIIKKSPSFQVFSYLYYSNAYNREKYSTMWINVVVKSWEKEKYVKKLIEMFEEIKRLTEVRSIKLSVIIFPEMNQLIDYQKYGAPRDKLLGILKDLNITYLDLYDTFRQKEDFSEYYLPGDTVHFTPDGHKIIAEELKNFTLVNK